VRFFLDNNLSPKIARALDCLTQPKHSVRHLRDLFAPETQDVTWMQELARQGSWIILSADVALAVILTRSGHGKRLVTQSFF
jgi:predicted nuclease of predicted toxin-antitoxin system